MRAAPLRGDCKICQAPDAARAAINAAIWPGDGIARSVTYRVDAVRIAGDVGVEIEVKTVTRHAEHIEQSWREVPPGQKLRDDEVPLTSDFASVMEQGGRLGMLGLKALADVIEQDPELWAMLRPKELIAAANLGVKAVVAREASQLKRNRQAIDVMAIFAESSNHISSSGSAHDDSVAADVADMKADLALERLQLAARSGHDASPAADDDDIPDDVLAAL